MFAVPGLVEMKLPDRRSCIAQYTVVLEMRELSSRLPLLSAR